MEEYGFNIIQKYPKLFGEKPFDIHNTLIGFGLEVSPYWFDILDKGFAEINSYIEDNKINDFRIVQVKEKFGTLRIYSKNGDTNIQKIIRDMEKETSHICEKCGKEAILRNVSGWITVICDSCLELEKNKRKF